MTKIAAKFACLVWVGCLLGGSVAASVARAQELLCEVTENGVRATGTVVLTKNGEQVLTGSCHRPLAAPTGEYEAIISVDGVLDRPSSSQRVLISGKGITTVRADFKTALVQVVVSREGKRAIGMVMLMRGPRMLGTLGSGIAAHVSAGTYTIVVKSRGDEQRFENIAFAAGERRTVEAKF